MLKLFSVRLKLTELRLVRFSIEISVRFISEMFDANFPHEARGAVADAKSVGSVLELYEILAGQGLALEKIYALTLR